MKYGQIAGNRHLNEFIYFCFRFICEEDQKKFVKKFNQQPHDSDQIMHTFRELILGAYLISIGFNARYDLSINSKTPDWCCLDDKSEVTAIVELMNIHLDRGTESEIKKKLGTGSIVFFLERPK